MKKLADVIFADILRIFCRHLNHLFRRCVCFYLIIQISIVFLKNISTFWQRENRLACKHTQWSGRHGKFFRIGYGVESQRFVRMSSKLLHAGVVSWKNDGKGMGIGKKANERQKKWTGNLINSPKNSRSGIYLIIFTAHWNAAERKATGLCKTNRPIQRLVLAKLLSERREIDIRKILSGSIWRY